MTEPNADPPTPPPLLSDEEARKSVKALAEKLAGMEKAGETRTGEYKNVRADLDAILSRLGELEKKNAGSPSGPAEGANQRKRGLFPFQWW